MSIEIIATWSEKRNEQHYQHPPTWTKRKLQTHEQITSLKKTIQ